MSNGYHTQWSTSWGIMATVTVCFTVDSERDSDLVQWLDSFRNRNRSQAIRNVLREHIRQGDVTLNDVYRVVKELEQRLQLGTEISGMSSQEADCDEPADVVEALDQLGL